MANYTKLKVIWKNNLNNIYKENTIIGVGQEAIINIDENSITSIYVNFKVNNEVYTDLVEINGNIINVPFKTDVLKVGTHQLEIVAYLKNGDVVPSPTFSYYVEESLANPNDITAETHYPTLIQLLEQIEEWNEDAVANEIERVVNEELRVESENSRLEYEDVRRSEEIERVENEALRKSAEIQRISEENERLKKEIERLNNEVKRVNNENNRIINENDRIANEEQRKSNEIDRQAYESNRLANEEQRVLDEILRNDSEEERLENENNRTLYETERKNDESERLTDEATRQNAELIRMANEEERLRKEVERLNNESIRQGFYNNYNNRIKQLENELDNLILDAGNSNPEIVNARTKEDGTSYLTLGDRLDETDLQIKRSQYININNYNFNLNGIDDDSSQLQKAIDDTIANGGKFVFPSNSKIKLSQTIYLLNQGKFNGGCEIDFNNAEIIVNNDFIIFDSGKVEEGIYSSIYNDDLDNKMSFGFVFGNFKVKSNTLRNEYVVRIKDWHQGCKLHSIVDESSSFICSKNSYYCEFSNLRNIAYEGSLRTKFLFEGVHNLCNMNRLMGANSEIIYKFTGNCAGIDFNNNSLEGGKIGILFEGYMWNFTLRNSYMENIKETVVKCTNSIGCHMSLKDNFFQFKPSDTDNYLIEMAKNETSKYEIYFDETNKILDMSNDRIFKGGSSISVNNITLPNEIMSPPNPGSNDVYKLKKDVSIYGKQSNINQLIYNDNIKGKVVNGLIPGYYSGSYTTGYSSAGIKGCGFPIMSDDAKKMTILTAITNIDTCLIYINLQVVTYLGTGYIRGLFMGNTFIGEKPEYLNISASTDTNSDNIKIEIIDTRENGGLGQWSNGEIRLI